MVEFFANVVRVSFEKAELKTLHPDHSIAFVLGLIVRKSVSPSPEKSNLLAISISSDKPSITWRIVAFLFSF